MIFDQTGVKSVDYLLKNDESSPEDPHSTTWERFDAFRTQKLNDPGFLWDHEMAHLGNDKNIKEILFLNFLK